MPDIKFSCPHCQQHISAEPTYAGLEIGCPACSGKMIVPGEPVAPVPPPPPPATQSAPISARVTSSSCPSCGVALARGAVLCTACGYNLRTGQRMVAGKPAAPGKPKADAWEVPWYKTAYPYLGLVVGIMALLYFLGRNNQGIMAVFVGIVAVYVITAHIIVAVAAFRTGIGTGFLTLCVPFFALYFVFKMSDSDTLKVIYGLAIVLNIALKFLELGGE